MAFLQLLLKARKLEQARLAYEDEKFKAIEISEGAKPHYSFRQRLRKWKLRCKRKVKEFVGRLTTCPEDSWFHRKALLLRTDGTFDNYILKSVLGFLGGIFLTYLFFVFFVFQLNFTLRSATMLCSLFGIILTLGLAFSYRVRCIVFLLLPQFFSKRGRQALMAYAFILALTGPAKNTLHNTGVLSESLACEQKQLKEAVEAVVDLIKQPFYALRDAVTRVIKTIKVVIKRIKETLVAMKRVVLSILKVIKSVFEWLGSVVNICNKKLGTPFDRCQRVFDGAVADCKAKLGPFFGSICNLTYIVGALCYVVKPLDFICMLVSYIADSIVGTVRRKIKKFTRHIRAMFYVRVKFSHSFHFATNQSRSFQEVSTGIVTEIRSRTDKFLTVFDWMSFGTSFFIFFMLLRVIHYRYKWLTNERFDNRYLTDDLRTIDLIRSRQDKETVLPLNRRERNKYIPLSSLTLIKMEKVKLARSTVFLGLATFKLCIHMLADYSLYWILSTIRYHGRFETKVQQPNSVGIYVSGNGYLAELYRSIVRSFSPQSWKDSTEIDSIPCLPDPIPPDFDRYAQIVSLIALSWFMAIFEPYGLRLRHVVMCYYHPARAKQRAVWLYNHIIRSRGSFLKFARRQLRRKFGMVAGEETERVTVKGRLAATCPLLQKIFGENRSKCLLCGSLQYNDDELYIKCPTAGCVGLFCRRCFVDLENLCTICKIPVEYGDMSDMSEERDSSDDETGKRIEKLLRKHRDRGEVGREGAKVERDVDGNREGDTEVVQAILRDEAGQTEGKFDESTGSSESLYSYGYQEESPVESSRLTVQKRSTFKDVEAQKIRDDVTIQIFNQPCRDEDSSSEGPTSCFVVRACRRRRAKRKKSSGSCVCPSREFSQFSGSSRDSESSEEVDEEEVVHIEVDDNSRRLLLPREEKRDIKDGRSDKNLQPRSSLTGRIVKMLKSRRSTGPLQTYRRVRKRGSDNDQSSSSTSCDGTCQFLSSKVREKNDDRGFNIYSKNYDSHRARRRNLRKHENVGPRNIHKCPLASQKFSTREPPRYFKSISRDTNYHEMDETRKKSLVGKCVREGEDINLSPATETCVRRSNKKNIVDERARVDSTDETAKEGSEEKYLENSDVTSDDTVTEEKTAEVDRQIRIGGGADTSDKRGNAKRLEPDIHDPLAGLELYGIEYKKRKRKETDRDIPVLKVDKATDLPDKTRGVQTKVRREKEPERNLGKLIERKRRKEKRGGKDRDRYSERDVSEISTSDKGKCLRRKCWLKKKKRLKRRHLCTRCKKTHKELRVCSPVDKIVMYSKSIQSSRIQLQDKGLQYEEDEPILISCPHLRKDSSKEYECLCSDQPRICNERNCPYLYKRKLFGYSELINQRGMKGTMKHKISKMAQTPREMALSPETKDEACSYSSIICQPAEAVLAQTDNEEETLPYQETDAFRKVVCEFRKRAEDQRVLKKESLISSSKTADKTKELQQLFPTEEKQRSSILSRFKDRISKKLRPTKKTNRAHDFQLDEIHENSDGSETESEKVSLLEKYPTNRSRSGNLSSADDTSDNNKMIY